MKLLLADFILTCNEKFEIILNGGVLFDEKIVDVGSGDELIAKYKDATIWQMPKNSVLLPGLINSHVHLEFSANTCTLRYGDFIVWLRSVIENRDELGLLATTELISKKLDEMLKSGTTSLGAISSFGADLEACVKCPQRVVYFNEVLGSAPNAVDAMYADFLGRLENSKAYKSDFFIPSISIHSPYSTHPILAKKALKDALNENCVVSTHFMESRAEREWLDDAKGDFKDFLGAFNPNAKPMCEGVEFVELFEKNKTLFTHATKSTKKEQEKIASQNASITHCPTSNRLLGVGRLKIEDIFQDINLTLGTDGLSSNISLSLFDEMRNALMMHADFKLEELAKLLLASVTKNAANALNLPCGEIRKELAADMIVAILPDACKIEDVALQLILHTHKAHLCIINGEEK